MMTAKLPGGDSAGTSRQMTLPRTGQDLEAEISEASRRRELDPE